MFLFPSAYLGIALGATERKDHTHSEYTYITWNGPKKKKKENG